MTEPLRRSERLRNKQLAKEGVVDTFLKNTHDSVRRSLRIQNKPPVQITDAHTKNKKDSTKQRIRVSSRKTKKTQQPPNDPAEQTIVPPIDTPLSNTDTQKQDVKQATSNDLSLNEIQNTTEKPPNKSLPRNLQLHIQTRHTSRLNKLKEKFRTKRMNKTDIIQYKLSQSDIEYINKAEPVAVNDTVIIPEHPSDDRDTIIDDLVSICFVGVVYTQDDISHQDCSKDLKNFILYNRFPSTLQKQNIYQQNRMERALNIYNNNPPYSQKHVIDIRGDNIQIKTFTFKYDSTVHIVVMGTAFNENVLKYQQEQLETDTISTDQCDLQFNRLNPNKWVEYKYVYPFSDPKSRTYTVSNFIWEPTEMLVYTHPSTIALSEKSCSDIGVVQEPIGCSCLDNYCRSPTTPDNEPFSGCKHMWYIRYLIVLGELRNR